MQNFRTIRQPLLGELAMSRKREREREERKMPFIVATYVYASSQGQRTHSARTKSTVDIQSFLWQIMRKFIFKYIFYNLFCCCPFNHSSVLRYKILCNNISARLKIPHLPSNLNSCKDCTIY